MAGDGRASPGAAGGGGGLPLQRATPAPRFSYTGRGSSVDPSRLVDERDQPFAPKQAQRESVFVLEASVPIPSRLPKLRGREPDVLGNDLLNLLRPAVAPMTEHR